MRTRNDPEQKLVLIILFHCRSPDLALAAVGGALVLGVYTIIKCRNSRQPDLTEPDRKKKIPRAKLLYYRGPRFYLTRHEYTEAKNAELVGRRTIE
jgi:hypothetical protein